MKRLVCVARLQYEKPCQAMTTATLLDITVAVMLALANCLARRFLKR